MKTRKLVLVLITFLSVSILFAQGDTVWYDSNWNVTEEENATYYRPNPEKKLNGYWLIDYYTSGMIQMEGLSKESDDEVFEGVIKWYYENGKVQQAIYYSEGKLNGSRKMYFKSGKLKNERYYVMGIVKGDYVSFYESGTKMIDGFYKNDNKHGEWTEYYQDGEKKAFGTYENGKKVGVWKHFHYNGSYE
ncbi:MAG: hypothetical protein COB60_00030 [Flavobacteriaceae bacterium]|nr:MAG: hypothetical protein COB60_00030 [Flavobacteriaceae bacterium]